MYWITKSPSLGELIASLASLSVTSVTLTAVEPAELKPSTVSCRACILILSLSTSFLRSAIAFKSESTNPLICSSEVAISWIRILSESASLRKAATAATSESIDPAEVFSFIIATIWSLSKPACTVPKNLITVTTSSESGASIRETVVPSVAK